MDASGSGTSPPGDLGVTQGVSDPATQLLPGPRRRDGRCGRPRSEYGDTVVHLLF
jgi:hypothetical protein